MPRQAPLRLIRRCKLYEHRGDWKPIPHLTRGIYVLYQARPPQNGRRVFEVKYIGVAGISKRPKSGIGGRLRSHHKTKDDWTHYSFFEVHDNISREEILELEALLLRIFRHDRRIKLANVQLGAPVLWRLAQKKAWSS